MFSQATPRRRIISTTVLLVLVSTIIPYQFAYMVGCIVQLATCVRARYHAKETVRSSFRLHLFPLYCEPRLTPLQKGTTHANFANFTYSLLILMLWILPINALVLLVWAHNLVVHWYMPFSSHHNILSIMPFVLLVETMTSGTMIPRMTTR